VGTAALGCPASEARLGASVMFRTYAARVRTVDFRRREGSVPSAGGIDAAG